MEEIRKKSITELKSYLITLIYMSQTLVPPSYKLENQTQLYNRQGRDEMISVGQSAVRISYFHGFIQCQSRHYHHHNNPHSVFVVLFVGKHFRST